jgi:hypothetical protein
MITLAEQLLRIVATLRAALGAYGIRLARPLHTAQLGTATYAAIPEPSALPPLAPDLWTLFWNRIGRAQRRFQALYAAWQEGTLKPLPPRTAAAASPTRQDTAAHPGPPRLPTAFAWAIGRVTEAGPAAGLLESLVHAPETERFVTEIPRAGRHLRPLCRALGVQPPAYLRLSPRPRAPRAPNPPRPPRSFFNDPTLKWRPWEKRAALALLKKYGRD